MKPLLPLVMLACLFIAVPSISQNVFDPADTIVRHNPASPLGSYTNPDPEKRGLQKWVTRETNGVSTGSSKWDASSFKSYFLNVNGRKVVFRLKYPKSYIDSLGTGKKYPVMLFFHGAGENGCPENGGIYNNEKQLLIGGALFRDRVNSGQFDGFLLYPQKQQPTDCWGNWSLSTSEYGPIMSLIDSLAKYVKLDIDRVLVTGLSAGGSAAFYVASNYATRIAKAAPSAAASGASNNNTFVHIPIWFATGGKDASPSPSAANSLLSKFKNMGMDVRYTLFPDQGHAMWNNHWREADFVPYMNDLHKANPHVFFLRNEFCKDSPISAQIGITGGFYAYEWQRNNVTIATRTNGVNTIVDGSAIISFTGNDITVNAHGTYRVRFKRSANAEWSVWSPKPVVVREKKVTQTAAIKITGARSRVVPAPDGSTKVPLELPAGFVRYEWYRASDNVIVSTSRTFTADPGQYKAKYYEEYGCGSNFSPVFTIVNANGDPKPSPAENLLAKSVSSTSIQLNWTDNTAAPVNETGFEIYRATSPGGPFQFLALVKANTTGYLDKTVAATQLYYYIVRAVNESGAAAPSNEAFAGNNPPSISSINTLHVRTDEVATVDFNITDPNPPVTVKIKGQLKFLALAQTGNDTYRITAAPKTNHIGWYQVEVEAKDSMGATATRTFTMVVSDKSTRTAYINFGNSSRPAPAPWNNWLGKRSANNVISNLKDVRNTTTPFSVTMVDSWSALTDLGHKSGNNSGVFPDTVLQSGIADSSPVRSIRIGGLNPSMLYNLVFVGSQNEGDNSVTEYSSGTEKSVLTARYNIRSTANLNGLVPNASGQITVSIRRINVGTFSYLNAMMIEEYAPSAGILSPVNLFAEPIDRNTMQLTWSDRTSNENSTDGYELEYATDSLFASNLKKVVIKGNATSHRLTSLTTHKRFWFRIRAKAGSSFSGYSNVFSAITPEYLVYVNFNYSVPNASSPWNNLMASPTSEQTISNLLNQSGTGSGISLTIERPFNGEFNAGMNTGNNSGVVPDRVFQSNFWLDRTQLCQIKLSKLNRSRRYRIGFIGSAGPLGWFKGNYTATYTVGNRTVYLNSWMNTSGIVWIGDITPDAGSNIIIRFSTTPEAMYAFNAGMIIQVHGDAEGGTMPNEATRDVSTPMTDIAARVDSTYTEPRVYPNPFGDFFNIQFYNPVANADVSADVFDMSGRLLGRRQFNNVPGGNVTIRMDHLNLKPSDKAVMVTMHLNGRKFKTFRLLHYVK